jgi:hypothetical protein
VIDVSDEKFIVPKRACIFIAASRPSLLKFTDFGYILVKNSLRALTSEIPLKVYA